MWTESCSPLTVASLLVVLAGLPGCVDNTESRAREAHRSPLGVVSAETQRPGDPVAGYRALVNNAYVSCGIPYDAYRRSAPPAKPEQLLPGRSGVNASLPYNLNFHVDRDGVALVVSNCLTCHAGYFDGKLVVGLGDENLDFSRDPVLAAEGVGAYVKGDAAAAAWTKWADRIGAIAPYIITDTIGANPAVNLTWALLSHRDPETLAWSTEPLMEPPPRRPLPVSVPPWWRMKKKNAMFYNAAGRGDHARHMILATLLCTDTVEEARTVDAYAPDIRAFIVSLEPPQYPYAVDRGLAGPGEQVFEQACARCHGSYGNSASYPNLLIGLEEIGTDPLLAKAAVGGDEDRFNHWVSASFYGEGSRVAPAPGYMPPPLDGVWATAPYLHNGSVPTIGVLLDSSKRPRYWTRSFDSRDYDRDSLGWRYTELEHGKAGADAERARRIYDTTLEGYSNRGHTFGDELNEIERRQLLEYLKTL